MTFEEKFIDKPAQNAKGRCPFKRIDHERAAITLHKFVNVFESLKAALDHLIDKKAGAFKLNHFHRQPLAHSKMRSLKRHGLSQADLAISNAGHDLFIGFDGRFGMQPNVAHQVEANLSGGVDVGSENALRH